jgi:hypothetical protein
MFTGIIEKAQNSPIAITPVTAFRTIAISPFLPFYISLQAITLK